MASKDRESILGHQPMPDRFDGGMTRRRNFLRLDETDLLPQRSKSPGPLRPLIGARDHDLPARVDEQREEPTGMSPSSTCRELLEDKAIVEDDLRSDETFVARFADPGLQRAKERYLPPVHFSR